MSTSSYLRLKLTLEFHQLGAANVRRAQNIGLPVYAETCPQYFHLTWNDLVSPPTSIDYSQVLRECTSLETVPFADLFRKQQNDLLASPSTGCF